MKRLFVIDNAYQDLTPALTYEGSELAVLILMNGETLANSLDRELEEKRLLARRIHEARRARGQACEVIVEWGSREEAVRNCLEREHAELLQ